MVPNFRSPDVHQQRAYEDITWTWTIPHKERNKKQRAWDFYNTTNNCGWKLRVGKMSKKDWYVAFFNEYTSMIPDNWVDLENRIIFWPPGPALKSKMKMMMPDDNWIKYNYKKILGPFAYRDANRVEKESVNMSTGEETDEALKKMQRKDEKRNPRPKKFSSDEQSYSPTDDSESEGSEVGGFQNFLTNLTKSCNRKTRRTASRDSSLRNISNVNNKKSNQNLVLPTPPKMKRSNEINGDNANIIEPETAISPSESEVGHENESFLNYNISNIFVQENLTNENRIVHEDALSNFADILNSQKQQRNENHLLYEDNAAQEKLQTNESRIVDKNALPDYSDTLTGQKQQRNEDDGVEFSDISEKLSDEEGTAGRGKITPGLPVKNLTNKKKSSIMGTTRGTANSAMKTAGEFPGTSQMSAISTNSNAETRYATLDDLNRFKKKLFMVDKRRKLAEEEAGLHQFSKDGILARLPVKTVEEMNNLDTLLKRDASARKEFKQILLKINGPNMKSFTNRSFRRLMTDKVGIEYSYSGQSRGKNKQYTTLSFKKLKICQYLIDIIVYSNFSYTESDCITYIKRWLNNSRQRLKSAQPLSDDEDEDEENPKGIKV